MRAYEKATYERAKKTYAMFILLYPFFLEDLDGEIWRDIKGYDGMYQISNYGRIKSFKKGNIKILKPNLHTGGYLYVILSKHNKTKHHYVHILVAQAFIPNPDGLPEVDHRYGNKFDNYAGNLRWVTPKQNSENTMALGLREFPEGEDCPNAVLNAALIQEIRRIHIPYDREFGSSALARKYGVSTGVINCAVRGKTYKNVPRDVDKSGEKV